MNPLICPGCGGVADNGHDREMPPNPYYCTACMAVAAAERERCAQLCESYAMPDGTSETAMVLAAAIRRMK